LEQISEAAQGEENEHSEEWLNAFSQEAKKKEVAALNLTKKEKEQANRLLTPWEMELEMLEDWMNNPEPVGDYHEQILAEENSEESLRIFSQGDEKVMKTAEMNSVVGWQVKATEEEGEHGMGDPGDLPNCNIILQPRRLQKKSQPLEQLDEVIKEIRELMLGSVETASEEKLRRRKEAAVAVQKQQ
jgi:hypothetical protein